MAQSGENSVSDSRYQMWRCIAAVSAVDGKVTDDEIKLVHSYIEKLPLSDEQRRGIEKEWTDPSTPEEIFENVTDPKDRAQVIYYARLLFWSDGDFDAQEQAVLKAFHTDVMSTVDLPKVMQSVDTVMASFHAEQEKKRQDRSFGEKLVDALVFWDMDR